MRWEKLGRIYVPDGTRRWMQQYAYPPTPLLLSAERLRVYVGFCDEQPVGRIGWVDVDPADPTRVLGVSESPVLDIGVPGAFDDHGVVPISVLRVGEEVYLYYVGFQLGHMVRYFLFVGLAISRDGGQTFHRHQRTPILERSDSELLNRTASYVIQEENRFRMWYVGGSDWTHVGGKPLPIYTMRYMESENGRHWPNEGRVCLDFANEDEHAFGRPWVERTAHGHRMFYSIRTRSKGYRLGYAESSDGLNWQRKDDEVGIDVSASGWDSQMIAYSALLHRGDRTHMLYCGNNCGQTGFGCAVLAETSK